MRIEDVQDRADGGYYATIDGFEAEFIGDGDPDTTSPCDACGRIGNVLGDCSLRILVCRECLEAAAEASHRKVEG